MTASPSHLTHDIPALPPGTRLTTLDNGLVVIVREDPSAPVVSAQAWCRAGSVDEGRWLGAGLSHMLEHMLFKGTATRGAGRIDQEVQDAGGYMNAYTSFDRTVFWINVPSSGASVAIDILCDVMQNAALPAEEIEKEKQVILREMDMNQDDPSRRASRRLFETAFTRSPYRYTVIGYPDVFNELKREDIVAYYREKYTPNNAFFVVVGDIKAAQVEEQIRSAYAKAKARPLPPAVLPLEPAQTAQREIVEEAAIELGHFHYGWHIPDIRHPDIPALDVLATLLGSGHSARLYQAVRERQAVVHSVDAWTYNPGNPGIIGISAVVDGQKFESAKAAILAEVERIKNEPVSQAELSKAVKQFTAGTLATRKTMQGQAQDLGCNWIAAHDLNFSQRYLAAVKLLTVEDLQRVARVHLRTQNRTLYALLPSGTLDQVTEASESIVDHAIQRIEFPNGLRLLIKEDDRLPFVEMRAVFKGGVLTESPENNGITTLLSKMLLKGTTRRTAEQIVTEIESLGGSIDTYGGNNSFGVSAEVLSSDFDEGLNLLCDVLLNPGFPEAGLAREKEAQLASVRGLRDHMLQCASKLMRRALFGERGYGLDSYGSETSIPQLDTTALRQFYRRLTIPNNCVLAIFGDVDPARVRSAVEKLLGGWTREGPVEQTASTPVTLDAILRVSETRDKKQAVIVVAFPGASIFDQDRYALELVQEALSDLGSRLFVRIRDNLGLAYYVGAQNFLGLHPGYFALYAGTSPENLATVEREMFQEIENLRRDGLHLEELKRAKAKLLGQKKIARQELGGYATATALDELYGLGYQNSDTEDAFYESVTLEDARRVIQRYLVPTAAVVSVIQPPNEAQNT